MSGRLLRRTALPALLSALLVLSVGLPTAPADELSGAQWKDLAKKSKKLMKETGRRPQKQAAVERLGRDNSQRGAELLIKWALRSLKLQQKEIATEVAETEKAFKRLDTQLRKAYKKAPRFPPPSWPAKHGNPWKNLKKKYEGALKKDEVERGVQFSIGEQLRRVTDPQAVTWLIEDGLPSVQKTKQTESLQVGIAKSILTQEQARALPEALKMAADPDRPKLRILALNWFGQHQIKAGFDALVQALSAKQIAVRRTAVLAMQGMDDPRCVKPLIDSMSQADAQLLQETDQVLHWYTGRSFESSAKVWKRWWKNEGAAWLADTGKAGERHAQRGEPTQGGTVTPTTFYGIPTKSHHVVFVLDRSGSMKTPAGHRSKKEKEKEKKPSAPVTGGKQKDKKGGGGDPTPVAGDTKMEVAINQLKRSVQRLDKKIKFSIVFYGSDVEVWKAPPELMPSNAKTKQDAIRWFEKIGPEGSTQLFGALMKALEYADTMGEDKKKQRTGADTIFLLSDGSPTHKNTGTPSPLSREEIDAAWDKFKTANELYHCVVHTIGIGPHHNRGLMQRIARETGGIYKAVGVN